MRILQVAPPWYTVPPAGYGGVEWVVALLADGLTDAGHDVTLVASGGSHTKADLVTVFDEPPEDAFGSAPHEVRQCVAAYSRRHDYDLVHDHTGVVGAALGALTDGPPVVHTWHGAWRPEIAAVYEALPPRLDLVAISEDHRVRAPAGVRCAGVVHNGIPIEHYPFRAEPSGRYLLFLGRASAAKGPEVAVDVARRLGLPLKMVVRASMPEEHEHWDRVVAPGLEGADVEVLEDVSEEDKLRLMGGAAATLMPIRWDEPFGLVMVESMACGTPVVVFSRGAAPEVVADGETGFVVPGDDLDAFCDAVARVDAIDRRACRERVERHFSGPAMVAGYERIYRQVVGRTAA